MHLGIDFGTCFTSAAVLTGNQFRFVRDQSGGNTLPFYASAACLTQDGQMLLGALAKNTARRDPTRFRQEFKRDLGSHTPYLLGDQEFLPQELIARLLARLREEAERMLGGPIPAAVLTVPASYDAYRRRLMREAGVAAGFRADGLLLLDEPEAAALTYDWQLQQQGAAIPEGAVVLVYDLGGGTFDAALMRKEGERFRSLAPPVGDPYCGGIDFDRAIYQEILSDADEELQELLSVENTSLSSLRMKLQITDFCREVKHQLSDLSQYEDVLPVLSADEFQLSRAAFSKRIGPYLERTIDLCRELLTRADCTPERVDGVLLVGGSSRIPAVMARLSEAFGRPLWQLDDPQQAVCMGAAILPGHQRLLKSAALERVARLDPLLVAAGRDQIDFWDTSTGERTRTLFGQPSIETVALSPDGKLLASGGADATIKLWDVAEGTPIRTLNHRKAVFCVAFSPDGSLLASASRDKTVKLWEVATGRLLRTLEDSFHMHSVVFSPDGATLASGTKAGVTIWNTTTGEVVRKIASAANTICRNAYSPDGRKITTIQHDQNIVVWDVETGSRLLTITGHTGNVRSVAFSPDGKTLASGSGVSDYTVRLWDASSGAPIRTLGMLVGEVQVAFSQDGTTLAAGIYGQQIHLWDVATGKLLQTLKGTSVSSLTYAPGDASGPASVEGHAGPVRALAIDAEGKRLLSGSGDKTLKIWDAETGEVLRTVSSTDGPITSAAFLAQSARFAAADPQLSFWSAAEAEAERVVPAFGPINGVNALATAPDGRYIATVNAEALLCLWDVDSQELACIFHGHRAAATSTSFSPDSRLVISGSADRTVKVWHIAEHRLLATLTGHTDGVLSVCVAADGMTLASAGSDHTIRLWDTATWRCVHTLTGHTDAVRSVAFSADGSTLVSAGADHAIRLWNVATGDLLDTLTSHEGPVNAALFAGDDTRLISGSDDRSVRFWKLEWA